MKRLITILFVVYFTVTNVYAFDGRVDVKFIGEVVSEVTGGKQGVCYQRLKIHKNLINKTDHAFKNTVIVARSCTINEIPDGVVAVSIEISDGSIQKDAWHLIGYEHVE